MSDSCPLCNASLAGEPIPEAVQDLYGGRSHFSRAMAFYDMTKDMTMSYSCPDCGGRWCRFCLRDALGPHKMGCRRPG